MLMTHRKLTLTAAALSLGPMLVYARPIIQVPIVDPVLQMTAWEVPIPEGWTLNGTMLPESSCVPATSPTFHVASSEGTYGAYLLPRIDWAWGARVRSSTDCLPLHEALTAKAFLSNLLESRGVKFVRDEPVPELEDMKRNNDSMNAQMGSMRHNTVDAARSLVNYSINGHPVEELVTATVQCFQATIIAVGQQFGCSAFVARWYAPLGKLDAMRPTFLAIKPSLNQSWMARWTRVMRDRINEIGAKQTEVLLQEGRLAQEARTTQQQTFMKSFALQGEARNQTFNEQQYNKQVQSDNFVDHILDCSRLYSEGNRVSVGNNCPNRQTF
jgi:hypothetical protein